MMEKISILSVFLGFILRCHAACRAECHFNEFYNKTRQCCEKCPACPAGTQIALNCGHNKSGRKTGKPACEPCVLGLTFNDKEGGSCRSCQSCEDKNKTKIKDCTVKSDTDCRCTNGKHETKDGDCKEQGLTQAIPGTTTMPAKTKSASPRNTQNHETTSSPTNMKDMSPRNTQEQGPTGTKMQKTTTNTTKVTQVDFDNLKEGRSQGEKLVYPYLKPGWIVLIILGTVAVIGIAVLFYRKQTRKRIHRFCCRNYQKISDVDPTQVALVVDSQHEGHYAEPAPNEAENNATPIPPGEEPVPRWYTSPTVEDVYCTTCRTRENEDWQMECACTMDKSETFIEELVPNTSSTETISDDYFRYTKESEQERQASTWKVSPSTSTSSRLSCPQTSQYYCCTCSLSSNCVAPSPHSGRSPERLYMSSSKNCATTLPTSRERSPDSWDMASSNSPCMSPNSQGRSPAHHRATPSSCVSSASSRERSPIPPSLPSVQSHSNFPEDHEMCNQSSEYAQKREPLTPVSVEAHDKEHDRNGSEAPRESLSPTSGKRKEGRNSPSPKKGVAFTRNHDSKMKENWTPKQTGGTNKDVTPIRTSDRGLAYDTNATSGSDMEIRPLKEEENDFSKHPRCDYRPIRRNENSQHRCSECCPQPDDSFFQLIDRERTCLKDAICRELNKSSDYKDVARYFRVDSEMAEYKDCANPSERVLDKIKASHPGLKLKEFEEMLCEKLVNERRDIVDIIQNHHISCTLCQRNRFDSKA